jgi:hypothetical protein
MPLTFDVDGDSYTLPPGDTRDWLHAMVHEPPGCWLLLVPGALAGDGARRLSRRLVDEDDPFDLDDLERVAESVLSAVCGMEFHAACRLAAAAWGNWVLFDGWASGASLDPLAQPIGRCVAAVYAWRRSLCAEQADLTRLDAEVWAPPPPRTVSGADRDPVPASWDDEREAASFLTAMGTLGRGARGRRSGPAAALGSAPTRA